MSRSESKSRYLMTVRQAAEFLNVSERHVYTMLAAGKIKGAKVGDVWRVNTRELYKSMGVPLPADLAGDPCAR